MKLMRYMSVEKYKDLLSTGTLFLPRYNLFEDKLEGTLDYVPPQKLIDEYTEKLRITTSMPQGEETLAREFLEAFEPALYHNFLRDFTYISCWHQGVNESALMWRAYAQDGVIIKSDLSSLRSSLGINVDGYQNHDGFWRCHGTDTSHGYEISVEVDEVKYRPLGHPIQAAGSERYFHKQPVYAEEEELRIVLQVRLGPQQKFNFPFLFQGEHPLHSDSEMNDLILRFWEDINRSYMKHSLILNSILLGPGVRCPVSINTLINEVIVSPGGNLSEIESLNRKFGLTASVEESIVKAKSAPTTFRIQLSDGRKIKFEI